MHHSTEIVLRLALAVIYGALVGFERERLDKAAGLRTHALVCMGAALVTVVSAFGFADVLAQKNTSLDPSRIAAQVVSGIGFLGAGAIMMRKQAIQGLTTAASVWGVAAIGLAVGGGLYLEASVGTGLALIILSGFVPLERWIASGRRLQNVTVSIKPKTLTFKDVKSLIENTSGCTVLRLYASYDEKTKNNLVDAVVKFKSADDILGLLDTLRATTGVVGVRSAVDLSRGTHDSSDGPEPSNHDTESRPAADTGDEL